jgi:predicted ribosome quality control (RQC) complex YloA/Tae2 family protein
MIESTFQVNSECTATIKVGKNALENDMLFNTSKPSDIWFHLKNGSSAHVYLSVSDELNKSDMKTIFVHCANLVKQHSKCNDKSKVIYLERQYLRKKDCQVGQVLLVKKPREL